MAKNKKRKPFRRKEDPNKINEKIRAPEVRLVGDNVDIGIYSLEEAKEIAKDQELDLVEISPKADPPVCKIINYKKFLYDQAKNKKKPAKVVIKEIRFTPNTDDHDFQFKLVHAKNFLEKGNKVKAFVFFRGRNIQFKERGELLLLKLAKELEDVGIPENLPKLDGRRMIMWIKPKKK